MLRFALNIKNPFHNTKGRWNGKDFVEFDKPISFLKHKAVSLQVSKFNSGELFGFDFAFSWRGEDHAGLFIDWTLFDYSVIFNFYDTRHWNYDKNCWHVYGEEEDE